jgi:Flp pilus assembly protein TadD
VRTYSRICIALAAGTLLLLPACDSTQPKTQPGALPIARTDVEPRLNASTYVAHGNLLEQQGNLEQAIVQYQEALKLTPDLLAARNRLGIVLNRLGRNDEATAEFRIALAKQPHAAHLHNNLGFSLYLEGKLVEAEQEFARAVELQPAFRRAHMNRGLALGKLGRFEEARAAFLLACDAADAHYNIAILQSDAGQFANAARSLEQALTANPNFTAAREQLRVIARLAAEKEDAERLAAAVQNDIESARTAPPGPLPEIAEPTPEIAGAPPPENAPSDAAIETPPAIAAANPPAGEIVTAPPVRPQKNWPPSAALRARATRSLTAIRQYFIPPLPQRVTSNPPTPSEAPNPVD